MQDRDPNIIQSGLSGTHTEDGVTVKLAIYRLEHEPNWALEVINEAGTSTVWDEVFDTDDAAFQEFRRTIDEEGMVTFLDNVIPFRRS
jgi:hypothetical protein